MSADKDGQDTDPETKSQTPGSAKSRQSDQGEAEGTSSRPNSSDKRDDTSSQKGSRTNSASSKGRSSPTGSVQNETKSDHGDEDNVTVKDDNEKNDNEAAESEDVHNEQTMSNEEDNEKAIEKTEEEMSEITETPPEEFDSQKFIKSMQEYMDLFRDPKWKGENIDEYPLMDLKRLIAKFTATVDDYKRYTNHCMTHVDEMKEQLTDLKDTIHENIKKEGGNSKSDGNPNAEEKELKAKVTQLQAEMAKAAEVVSRSVQIATETESSAAEAQLEAEKAREEAVRMQEEFEAREREKESKKREEQQKKKDEEERKRAEEERQKEEKEKKEKEERLKRQKSQMEKKAPEWEKWDPSTFNVEEGEFDQGIGCLIRGRPGEFNPDDLEVKVVKQLDATFTYNENEELIGNIVSIKPKDEDAKLKSSIYVSLPHCISRQSALWREPVVKAEIDGKWIEVPSQEVTMDEYKDLKFVQGEVTQYTNVAVISRFKKEALLLPKKGGKSLSSIDARICVTTPKNTFKYVEQVTIQIQPVDSASQKELTQKKLECKDMLTSSSILRTTWSNEKDWKNPLYLSLPVPPNPVRARKAAAAKAAKEAKMQMGEKKAAMMDSESDESKRRKVQASGNQNKWYMGEYGSNDDDETDSLYLLEKQDNGKWIQPAGADVTALKLDMVHITIAKPLKRFLVLRTRTNVDVKDAIKMAEVIEDYLSKRIVTVVIKQSSDDWCDVRLNVVPIQKVDRLLKTLESDGYTEGPAPSAYISIKEGDILEFGFRMNIKNQNENNGPLRVVYNSQLKTSLDFTVREQDKFLQKSYTVYRGFIQAFHYYTITEEYKPDKKKQKELDKKKADRKKEEVKRKLEEKRKKEEDDNKQEGDANENKENSNEDKENEENKAAEHEPEEEEDEEPKEIIVEKKDLLTECVISIPKEEEHISPRQKVPIIIKRNRDPIDADFLQHIAEELGDEWQRLSNLLNVRKNRIQAIMVVSRDNHQKRDEAAKYDMLMTWLKKVPRGMNKVAKLADALKAVGRRDLYEEVYDAQRDFITKQKESA
ncbi:unnamed protein product [Owenia fusiformis]|uniref:Uncharacterized protein n=1 Tax=Owenia fusiformis TaxID=6347 RepID=A0A8J1Y3U7_OWEFU|nr:unnamed protein product [Owenia fusiformis]